MTIVAETPRLLVRTFHTQDVVQLCELTRSAGFAEHAVSSYHHFTKDQAQIWIQKEIDRFQKNGLGRFAVTQKNADQIIGVSGLFEMLPPDEAFVELNYRYPTAARGKGFATEAAMGILRYGFQSLNLSEIHAVTELENASSKSVLKRIGMSFVETIEYERSQWERWRILKEK